MTPERWARIEEIYQEALEHEDSARAEFLRQACLGDEELRREVQSLLAQKTSQAGILERPVWEAVDGIPFADAAVPELAPGTHLGPYVIEEQLGAGGMGQVYRATDTRLGRAVAIKVSNEKFGARFEREARTISALNHPHICTLFDVGPNYLVMELVDGETLAARLKRGKLSVADTVKFGGQIADGLAAAHAKGIVHRDLKPHNVMLAKSGAKVLDFGLAKSQMDTTMTASHAVMGTPAYMAPEQFAGKDADARTDIFALGLMLFEMATGKRVERGQAPSMEQLPPQLAHVIERCLAPDPENRWQTARDVQKELAWALAASNTVPAVQSSSSRRWAWMTAGIVAIALTGYVIHIYSSSSVSERTVRFSLTNQNTGLKINGLPLPAPDGTAVVFSANDSQGRHLLWVRSLDSEEPKPLSGTDDPLGPFWSPDGRWIGFYSQGKLKKVSRDGANLQTITPLPNIFGNSAWGADGQILLTPENRGPIYRISDSGGTLQQVSKLDASRSENSHRAVSFLPDGRHFLFIARCSIRENNALYEGSLDSAEIRRIAHIDSNVAYIPAINARSAMLLFARDNTLFRQAFDGSKLLGDPVPLMNISYEAIGAHGDFALSVNGTMLVTRPQFNTDTRLKWFSRVGATIGTLGPPGEYQQPRISPDGSRVLFNRPDDNGGNRDVWLIETERDVSERLTVDPSNEFNPIWAPDGRRILFASDRNGALRGRAWEKTSMEPGAGERMLNQFPAFSNPDDWSRDGKWIVFTNDHEILVAPGTDGKIPFKFLSSQFSFRAPRISPDSKWIAYESNESGHFEIYVRSFEGRPADSGRKIQISEHGGYFANWSRDGKELFFLGPDSKLYVTSVANLASTGAVSSPRPLFETCPGSTPTSAWTQGYPYDVAPDGQKFLFVCGGEEANHYSIFVNWQPQ